MIASTDLTSSDFTVTKSVGEDIDGKFLSHRVEKINIIDEKKNFLFFSYILVVL